MLLDIFMVENYWRRFMIYIGGKGIRVRIVFSLVIGIK